MITKLHPNSEVSHVVNSFLRAHATAINSIGYYCLFIGMIIAFFDLVLNIICICFDGDFSLFDNYVPAIADLSKFVISTLIFFVYKEVPVLRTFCVCIIPIVTSIIYSETYKSIDNFDSTYEK